MPLAVMMRRKAAIPARQNPGDLGDRHMGSDDRKPGRGLATGIAVSANPERRTSWGKRPRRVAGG